MLSCSTFYLFYLNVRYLIYNPVFYQLEYLWERSAIIHKQPFLVFVCSGPCKMQMWISTCLTQSRSRTWRRGRSRSPEQSRTGRRRPGRWPERRWDTSSFPFYHTDRPTPVHPPSWQHTPADLQTRTLIWSTTITMYIQLQKSTSPQGGSLWPCMSTNPHSSYRGLHSCMKALISICRYSLWSII